MFTSPIDGLPDRRDHRHFVEALSIIADQLAAGTCQAEAVEALPVEGLTSLRRIIAVSRGMAESPKPRALDAELAWLQTAACVYHGGILAGVELRRILR